MSNTENPVIAAESAVQTAEQGTQTSVPKPEPKLEEDENEGLSDEGTTLSAVLMAKRAKREVGKQGGRRIKKAKGSKKAGVSKKELEAGALPNEDLDGGGEGDVGDDEGKGKRKRKKKPAGEDETEIGDEKTDEGSAPKPWPVRAKKKLAKKGSEDKNEDEEKPKKKRVAKKMAKTKKEVKKRPKKEPVFKKGKWNPHVVLLSLEKEREAINDNLFVSCCVECANRNPIRAVITNNLKLMQNCISGCKHISTLYDTWSAEIEHNAMYYALVTNNLKMVDALLQANRKPQHRCRRPNYLISYLDTGMVSSKAYGVKVRKVQMARGNRQGNNAFLEKSSCDSVNMYDWDFKGILEHPQLEYTTIEKLIVLEPATESMLNESIIYAIISGNRKIAAFLIKRIKELSNYGFNNLHFEVLVLDGEELTPFQKGSVHKKPTGNDQVTPTHCACINPNTKYLRAIFDADPNVNITDLFNRKPIHYAAACESSGPLELLLDYGANPTDLDNQKQSPLHYAARYGRAANVRLLIDKAPLLLKARDKSGMMPFHYACKFGHLDAVKAFVDKGIKINLGSGSARLTPLGFAAAYNHYEVCEYLINNKARVLSKDKFKRTPLAMAARNGNAKVLNLLLQRGSVWDDPDSSGNTPLHYAAAYGWLECAEELVKAGANVNANSSWKITPLNIAMLKNHFGIVKYLLNQPGIDVNCKDEQGRTLVSLATELTTDSALEYMTYLLQEKKADPNVSDINGETPLHHLVSKQIVVNQYSAEEGRNLAPEEVREQTQKLTELRKDMIMLLLKHGANINLADKRGRTLFDKCLLNENYELLELFTGIASFSAQPVLLFSFAGLIYNPRLKRTFDYLLKNSTLTAEVMNILDDDGYTPFLSYLKYFVDNCSEFYQKIYSYVEFQLKKLKYEGAVDFSKECLNITYDNYMSEARDANATTSMMVNNYYLYTGDIEYVREVTLSEFKSSFVDVLVKVLKSFILFGSDPKLKVGKLRSVREPATVSQLLNGSSAFPGADEEESEDPAFKLPAKLQQFLPQPGSAVPQGPVVEYCADGLCTAWHLLVKKPLKELMALLEPLNIPIDDGDFMGETPFMKSVSVYNNYTQPFMTYEDLYPFFVTHGASIDKPNSKGVTPFLRAVESNDFSRAFHLARAGANININVNDRSGNFALKYTVNNNDVMNTKLLLEEFKADPNKSDSMGRTCMHWAINNSSPTIDSTSEMENLLLDFGADVNAIDARGRSPLHYAFVKIGQWNDDSVIDPIEAVTTLCSKLEININVQDRWGKTPLHYAAQRNSTICSIFLLNRGASLEAKDRYGNTPLATAFLHSHPDYAITLIERNADVSTLVYPENPELVKEDEEKEAGEEGEEEKPKKKIEKADGFHPEYKKKRKCPRHKKRPFGTAKYANPMVYGNNNMRTNVQMSARTVTDSPKSMFRIAIRMGWQGLLYLLLDKNYDYMLGMEDALSEGKYQLLLNLLKKTAQDAVVQRFNDKQQNLMHILALHGGGASYTKLQEIYQQFVKRGVKHMAIDTFGRSALHYAVISQNCRMISILLNAHYDPNVVDKEGFTAMALLVRGEGIEDSEDMVNELLLAGSSLNVLYKETHYNKVKSGDEPPKDYMTTPLIHLVRYSLATSWSMTMKKLVASFLEKGADPTISDSDGRDIFMYAALENSCEVLSFILKNTRQFNRKAADKYGKTAVHYAVRQYSIGSYQNAELLDLLLGNQFDCTVPDSQGLTPADYAAGQANGVMANVFRKYGVVVPAKGGQAWSPEVRKLADWPLEVDFGSDAEKYLQTIQEIIENGTKKPKAKVDSVGNDNEPLEVVCDDKDEPYDCYMNKVNLKNGTYGEYLFYRMQLIRNTNRDVYMVYTRWGRIGETGMFQKTPFGTKEEAATEFGKIFKSKSGNEWANRHEFKKMKKRYVLMSIKSQGLRYKQLIRPFDFKHLPHKSELAKPVRRLMKLVVDVASYERAMNQYGIDPEELPITRLKRETLSECRSLLDKLGGEVEKLGKEREKGIQANADALEELYDKINEISSQYYELLPQAAYREFKPPPLVTKEQLNQQYVILDDLLNIESASKILLGAQSRLAEVNPLDYCYKALAIELEDVQENCEEYDLIKQYVSRSSSSELSTGSIKIENIFRVTRRGEHEQFEPFLKLRNRWLLYHGSKTSNFLGILSQGLRIAPPNVAVTGWAFGKGIYFADTFAKSAGYCYTYGAGGDGSLLMLICEVALGKISDAFAATFSNEGPPNGYNSVRARGSTGPNMDKRLYLEDGSEMPIGEIVSNNDRMLLYVAANEYVVFNPNQVKIRYLIKWRSGSD